MKQYYLIALIFSFSFSMAQTSTNVVTLVEGSTYIGYLGRGATITSGWNQTPDILALTYQGRDFAIGGWGKTGGTWMGPSFFINSDNGNIGIGTSSPYSKLDVAGVIRYGNNSSSIGSLSYGTGVITLEASSANTSIALIPSGTGNVGIGVTDTKGYKLALAGNMIAESVKVKLQSAWPDFVFDKSYALPTLQETEAYIKQKGHLPGISTAAEVNANGIDLGEMNSQLLQKIEELTLHLIEQNKAVEIQNNKLLNQQKALERQQQEIKELKSKIR